MKSSRVFVVRSPYFDAPWYRNSQKLKFGSDFLSKLHYLLIGHRNLFDPNPIFNSKWYRYQCKELGLTTTENAVSHYIREGWINGLDPHPLFSTSWYLRFYTDVEFAQVDPLRHYIEFGIKEDRCISNWFIASEAIELNDGITNKKQAVELCFKSDQVGAFQGRKKMKAPISSIE